MEEYSKNLNNVFKETQYKIRDFCNQYINPTLQIGLILFAIAVHKLYKIIKRYKDNPAKL